MSDKEIDIIHEGIEALLQAGQFEFVDWLMMSIDDGHIDLSDRLSVLRATLPAKSKLRVRYRFFHAVRGALFAQKDFVDANALLKGLE